ncbi:BnaC07g50940D [Brassica napus]|uniref:RING-type E3 ubiquitin transferase n=1 Tax=Brassica napus TaxID=3708 RepID=A0A078JF70_BRANA|nr:BnaC07g50940D [Brassica napus]
MDSMRADLIRGLETSLPTTFDREHFFALLVSGDVDGAEEYLSVFTTQDSNYYSNLMFYFVKRQRFFKFLVEGENIKAGFLLIFSRPYGMMEMPIPETDEFISRDIQRIAHEGLKEWEDARDNGYTFDILSVAKSFTDEMFTMMNQLIPMNPDLHKKEEGEDISSQMHKLHLQDNHAVAFNGGEMNKDKDSPKLTIYMVALLYPVGDEVGRLHCEHTYHLKCVQEWLRMKSWCPICKTTADTSSPSK